MVLFISHWQNISSHLYADSKSSVVIICCSVPQGSVLGPRMYILYTADLEDAVAAHDVRLHAYAEDTRLYLKCHTQEAMTAAHTLEACIDVTAWMNMNRLMLNADKTDLLWARSKYGSALLGSSGPSLQLGAETIKASDHVRLLGVTISSDLSLDKHLFYMFNVLLLAPSDLPITSITRHRLRSGSCTHSHCVPCVDYCNTVLAGAARTITDRFQRVLNAAARVVSGTRKFDGGLFQLLHSELHWLDIPQRVLYKLRVTVHRCQLSAE